MDKGTWALAQLRKAPPCSVSIRSWSFQWTEMGEGMASTSSLVGLLPGGRVWPWECTGWEMEACLGACCCWNCCGCCCCCGCGGRSVSMAW
jgi:hypothetical protein